MPSGLELDEVADLVPALRLLTGPVDLVVALPRAHPLDALGRAKLELLLLLLIDDGAHAANVRVSRKSKNQLLSEASENVHYAGGQIRNREQLAEHYRGVGIFLRCEAHADIARHDHRRDLAQKSEQRGRIVSYDPD